MKPEIEAWNKRLDVIENMGLAVNKIQCELFLMARALIIYIAKKVDHYGPINMVLYCPACGTQHVDEPHGPWTNPPHRSHLCHDCNHIWRPADVPTNGVRETLTKGTGDLPIRTPHKAGTMDADTCHQIFIALKKRGFKEAAKVIEVEFNR